MPTRRRNVRAALAPVAVPHGGPGYCCCCKAGLSARVHRMLMAPACELIHGLTDEDWPSFKLLELLEPDPVLLGCSRRVLLSTRIEPVPPSCDGRIRAVWQKCLGKKYPLPFELAQFRHDGVLRAL
jgi:hypothetical protein